MQPISLPDNPLDMRVSLRVLDTLDANGRVWLKATASLPRVRALVAHHIDAAIVRQALAQQWHALVQLAGNDERPIIMGFAKEQLDDAAPACNDRPCNEIVLGDGVARLFVEHNTLYITAPAIVSRAQGRHRVLGGTLELG